jgi:hypothetical protein
VILVAAACGPGARTGPDAAAHDGIDAAAGSMSETCDLPATSCVVEKPYCCFIGFDDGAYYCSEYFWGDLYHDCWEHPLDGVLTACDVPTGRGCDESQPICCELVGETYCTSHAYLGGAWNCTISSLPVTMGSE